MTAYLPLAPILSASRDSFRDCISSLPLLLGLFPSIESSILKGCSDHKCNDVFLGEVRRLGEKTQISNTYKNTAWGKLYEFVENRSFYFRTSSQLAVKILLMSIMEEQPNKIIKNPCIFSNAWIFSMEFPGKLVEMVCPNPAHSSWLYFIEKAIPKYNVSESNIDQYWFI